MDILYRDEDFVFSYRVGGILTHGGKVLLQRPKDDDFAIIGGHVMRFETGEQALRREFREELHAQIAVDRLMAVGEIFFPWGKRRCHQISLYYAVYLTEPGIPLDGTFRGYDELGGERIDLDYCWVPIEQLRAGLRVYPLELIPYITDPTPEVVHFVSREDLPELTRPKDGERP